MHRASQISFSGLNPKEKKALVYPILFTQMVCGTLYLNIVSFYPLYAEQKFPGYMTSTLVAVAMNTFELAGVLSTPIHAVSISKMGRKNSILIGLLVLFICNTAMGYISVIDDSGAKFFWFTCLIRFFQGYGDSLVMTTNFSVISSNFSDDREMYIGYLEASEGMGLMMGPALGSVVYGAFGYEWAFYSFSIMIVMTFVVQMIFLPNHLN